MATGGDFPGTIQGPVQGYILCATPRSGSTLLCGLLAATGQAGDPHSYFRREDIAEWAAHWGLSPQEAPPGTALQDPGFARAYLDAALSAGRAGTGLFGLRLMAETLPELNTILNRLYPGLPHDRARLERAFGRLAFVHLSRGDLLAQAISLVRARQTGLWHRAPDGSDVERLGPPRAPRYDPAAIRSELAQLQQDAARWDIWFADEGITPVTLHYEELAADPAAALARACGALGITPPPAAQIRPHVAPLADRLNHEWAARFRAETG